MTLPDIGELVTPVDDPCQYHPAWRSILAGYLFSSGARGEEDFKSLAMTGCLEVRTVVPKAKPKGKGKGKPKPKDEVTVRMHRVVPFQSNPEYRPFVSDKWIQAMVRMMDDEVSGRPLSDESVPIKLATRWYSEMESEAAMRKRLEPLLLTDIGIDIVTLDLVGVPSAQPAIEAYEKLYFNCRDDKFALSPSAQLIQRLAMPWGPLKTFCRKWEEVDEDGFVIGDGRPLAKESDIWRAIAATMGYEALIYHWRWDGRAHGLKENSIRNMIDMGWKASVSRLLSDMYTGDIKHEDAARLLATFTAHAKFLSDDRREGNEGEDTTIALMAILKAAAPKMRVLKEGSAGMITNNDIQTRIAAQQAIDKTSIQDAGKQVQDEVIDAQISQAIEGE